MMTIAEPLVTRLGPENVQAAQTLFSLISDVFCIEQPHLSDDYVRSLLEHDEFWALTATVDEKIIGGLTAHALRQTTAEGKELFIYDIAVHPDHQRQGHGRRLIDRLRSAAATQDIDTLFVAADNDDVHALDFYQALGGTASPVTFFEFQATAPGLEAARPSRPAP